MAPVFGGSLVKSLLYEALCSQSLHQTEICALPTTLTVPTLNFVARSDRGPTFTLAGGPPQLANWSARRPRNFARILAALLGKIFGFPSLTPHAAEPDPKAVGSHFERAGRDGAHTHRVSCLPGTAAPRPNYTCRSDARVNHVTLGLARQPFAGRSDGAGEVLAERAWTWVETWDEGYHGETVLFCARRGPWRDAGIFAFQRRISRRRGLLYRIVILGCLR